MNITNKGTPNTTILLPGGCSSKCHFCWWNRDVALPDPTEYIDRLRDTLINLPPEFRTVTISGGEPTESPFLMRVLDLLAAINPAKGRFDRVVLSTNGINLSSFLSYLKNTVDFVNISRHAMSDAQNAFVFQNSQVPTQCQLKDLIQRLGGHAPRIGVTLNRVINSGTKVGDCYDYIHMARELGAHSVCFRKLAGDVTPTLTEQIIVQAHPKIMAQSQCPVCRGIEHLVNGFPVRWKCSVMEPSIQTNGVYEIIVHPDGNAYADWRKQMPINPLIRRRDNRNAEIQDLRLTAEIQALREEFEGIQLRLSALASEQLKLRRGANYQPPAAPVRHATRSSGCGSSGCGSSGCG